MTNGQLDFSLKNEIEALGTKQNKELIPVPYSVNVTQERHDGETVNNVWWFLSAGVIPSWDTVEWNNSAKISLPGEEFIVNGKSNRLQLNGWLFLPFQLLSFQFENYEDTMNVPYFMVDNDRVERKIAKAIDSHLTKRRYDSAITTMAKEARKKLSDGKALSESDLHLLDARRDPNDSSFFVDMAKHPKMAEKSREALGHVSSVDALADIAIHAKLPEIRKSAAVRISGLSESRFAILAGQSDDPVVAGAFLGKVSHNAELAKVVASAKLKPIRQAALAKICDDATLWKILVSTGITPDLKLAAVNKVEGEAMLGQIATEAADKSIRAAAIAKLRNDSLLLPVVLGDSSQENRLAAMKHISGTNALNVILQKSMDESIRQKALSGVTDLVVLKRTVMTDNSVMVRKSALERIRDESTIAEIAQHNDSVEIRRLAFLLIEDEATAVKLVETERDEDNLLAILQKVGNQEVLSQMAENAESAKVRAYAAGRLPEDDAALVRIAENDLDSSVRAVAIDRVTTSAVLARVAKSDFDPKLRIKALVRVSDTEVLKSIVENDSDLEVCLAALAKIDDSDFLARVAKEDEDDAVRLAAVKRIFDEEVLKQVVLNDSESKVRLEALPKISDSETLEQIARNDVDPEMRQQALRKINNQGVLAYIAQNDSDKFVRKVAVSRLHDQDSLLRIIDNDHDSEIRKAAFGKLTRESKIKIARSIEKKGERSGGLNLRGFRLGMDEIDAAILAEIILPNSPLFAFATISNGRVTKFSFSAEELSAILSDSGRLSVDELPSYLGSALGCSFRYSPETLSKDGTDFAKQDIYTCSTIGGESLTLYVSQWEEIPSGVQHLVRMAQFDAPFDDPGFYVIGFQAALAKRLDEAKQKSNPKPGTLIWTRR